MNELMNMLDMFIICLAIGSCFFFTGSASCGMEPSDVDELLSLYAIQTK